MDENREFSNSVRIFRPKSELYKNSFIFIAFDEEISLNNNNYQLLEYSGEVQDKEYLLKIPNFFTKDDSFQLGSFYDNKYKIIQKVDYKDDLNLIRNFITKNNLEQE